MALHHLIVFLLLAVALSRSHPLSISTTENKATDAEYRLSNAAVPEHYKIKLTLAEDFLEKKTFSGEVEITVKVTDTAKPEEDRKNITVHIKDFKTKLTKDNVILIDADDTTTPLTNLLDGKDPVENEELHMVTFNLKTNEKLANNTKYILKIEYIGQLHDDMYGFYLSSYKEGTNTEWIAATQFQPTHARRAFPCFDEPHLKAKFDITIVHPKDYSALSNTEGLRKEISDKVAETKFPTTPVMSTYLIAFVVHKNLGIMSAKSDGITNRAWSQQALIETAAYGFHMAPKILKVMETFTGIPYSISTLTKLDQVAVPDFSAGAMENWGLVTYRENALLWDPVESTTRNKQRVAAVVAHELAHMWFGNLITTEWWDTTWLNEGFARYFEYHATAKVETEWDLKNQFIVEQQQTVLNVDAVSTVHALTSTVNTPSQISSKFDSITYNKGASIIRMMELIMGEENFFKGIKDYFDNSMVAHFGSTTPTKLWNSMTKFVTTSAKLPTGVTLEQIMKGWTETAGFPVVNATAGEDKKVVLEAKRFLFDDISKPSDWYIPITYTTSKQKDFGKTDPKAWIQKQDKLNVDFELTDDSWIIFNIRSSAYIRVNYDEKLWGAIQKALQTKHSDIDVLSRAQIADDVLSLARTDLATYKIALNVLLYLEKEEDYYPWYSAFNGFAFLLRRVGGDEELSTYLNKYISSRMNALYESVSFESRPQKQIDVHKKVLGLNWACQLDHEECVGKSQELFKAHKDNPIEPNVRSTVYCTAVRHDEENKNWQTLRDQLKTTVLASEISTIISALGCSKNKTTLEKYLKESIDPNSDIRRQDASAVYTAVISGNSENVPVALDFLIANYAEIEKQYHGVNALANVITATADRLTTKAQVEKFKQFVIDTGTELGAAQSAADNAVKTCEANMNWVEKNKQDLLTTLKEIVDGGDPEPTTEPSTTPGGATSVTVSTTVFILSILAFLNRW